MEIDREKEFYMSTLPVLMRGTGGGFDYICIAVRGNVAFGVKLDYVGLSASALRTDFRVRAAIITPEFYKRVTKGGEATQSFDKPSEAFPGDWANDAPFRASFEKKKKTEFELKIDEDGNFVLLDQLPGLIEEAINDFMAHVQLPDDAIIIVSKDELRDHIQRLMYGHVLVLWGVACQQHFSDNPVTQTLVSGGEKTSSDKGTYEPSLGDAEDLLEGDDDDAYPDDWDADPDLEDPDAAATEEPGPEPEPEEENVDYGDKVTPFPKSGA